MEENFFTPKTFEDFLKILTALGAVCAFIWGIFVWREDRKRDAVNKRIEATKPFLSLQLDLYLQTVRVTSSLVSNFDEANPSAIINTSDYLKFWQFYWGELAIVENGKVAEHMKVFGDALKRENVTKAELQGLCLLITRACRHSLDKSWNITAWTNPDKATS